MRFVLYTNSLSEHQLPLAREIVRQIGDENFRYVYTGESSQKFQESHAQEPWIRCSKDDPWLEQADVMLVGGIRPVELLERRAEKGLKTYYMSERWFKPLALFDLRLFDCLISVVLPGWVRMWVPGYRRMAKWFVRWANENACVKFLPIGPWAAVDFSRLGVREDKMMPWGDFVSPSVGGRSRKKEGPLKVLWAGRELRWKRVRDIEKAVALANKKMEGEQRTVCFTKLTGVTMAEVRKAMREHDVYVLASDATEGWGCVVNEALEEGMRVLGTFEAGASAAILPKERLYHAGDVKALSRLLELEAQGGGSLPPCSIGEWAAQAAATRLLKEAGYAVS